MTNYQVFNDDLNNKPQKTNLKFDLEKRCEEFGVAIIRFVQPINQDCITRPLISQIVRSATSIGANYCEANDSISKKEFIHRLYISRKEAKETKHWLRMLMGASKLDDEQINKHINEAQELNLIFSAIIIKCKANY